MSFVRVHFTCHRLLLLPLLKKMVKSIVILVLVIPMIDSTLGLSTLGSGSIIRSRQRHGKTVDISKMVCLYFDLSVSSLLGGGGG